MRGDRGGEEKEGESGDKRGKRERGEAEKDRKSW